MNEFVSWHNKTIGGKVVDALKKNNFSAMYVDTRQEAVEAVMALVPADATVGSGGSWTLQELELLAKLEERGNKVLNAAKPGLSKEEMVAMRRQHLTCDVYLTSTNAVTLDGKLVNTDATGNRVAAMVFGPKKVIIVAGINKVVKDVPEAQTRIKLCAAPINNKRLGRPNPCVQTGTCMNCQGPTRICNITAIMEKRPALTDVHVIIVGEELGF